MFGPARRRASRHAALIGLAAAGFVCDARAHIDLVSPEPREHGRRRDPNSNLKQGPCGQVVNGRTDTVSVFEPGQTLEVTWAETTDHRSYYRVAFDVDGDDAFPIFAGTGVGAEGIDPSGPCPVDGQVILAYDMDDRMGGRHTLEVRLPDVECERCTLQVVQFMYDTGRPYYFQCADVALRRARSADDPLDAGTGDAGAASLSSDAAATPVPPSPSAAAGCSIQIASGERPPRSNTGDEAPPAAEDPPAAASDGPSTPVPARRGSSSGCSLVAARESSNVARSLLLFAAWAISRTRRLGRRIARADTSR